MAANSNPDIAGYAAYLESHDKTVRTPAQSLSVFSRFLLESGATQIEGLTVQGVIAYASWLKGKDLSPRTRATYLACLSGYYRYAVRAGILSPTAQELEQVRAELSDLLADLGRRIRRDPLHKRLPPEDVIAAVLKATEVPESASGNTPLCALRDRALLLTLASTGARVAELARLRRRDLDPEHRAATVTGKGGKTRTVYFSPEAWSALEAYTFAWLGHGNREKYDSFPTFPSEKRGKPTKTPLSVRSIQHIVQSIAHAAGLDGKFHLTPHAFRHYVATKFLQATGNLAATQDLLGHASPNTTRVYAAVDSEQLRSLHQATFNR